LLTYLILPFWLLRGGGLKEVHGLLQDLWNM